MNASPTGRATPSAPRTVCRTRRRTPSPAQRRFIIESPDDFLTSYTRLRVALAADTVAGRKHQTVVIRRHREDGTYVVGYITLVDAGHGSSIGVEAFAGGARFYIGHATKGAGYVTYRIGSPETVARKIARTLEGLGASRFDLKYANGNMPHSMLTRSIELYGTQVAPLVRDMLA